MVNKGNSASHETSSSSSGTSSHETAAWWHLMADSVALLTINVAVKVNVTSASVPGAPVSAGCVF